MEPGNWSQEPSRSTIVIEDSSCWVLPGGSVERMEPGHPRGFLSVVSIYEVLLQLLNLNAKYVPGVDESYNQLYLLYFHLPCIGEHF